MSKIVLSGNEFRLLSEHFKASKEGAHVKWRDFSDSVDEVFTKGWAASDAQVLDDYNVGNARAYPWP